MERGNSIIGIYPVDFDRGHVTGHPGKRVTLCTKADLTTMPEVERDRYLIELYYKKERELRDQFLYERVQVKAKKKEKKASNFKEASEAWLREVESTLSPKTLKTYTLTTKLYVECNGNHRLNDFDRDYNIKFFTFLTNYKSNKAPFKTISKDTQNGHMRQLQNFLNWAYDNEYLDKRFHLKKAKRVKKDIHTFSPEEVEKLADYIKTQAEQDIDPRMNRMNKNLMRAYMIARHTLVRKGSIWALKLENIDLDRGFIYFQDNPDLNWHPKGMKWPNKPINKTLRKFLEEDLKNRGELEKYYVDNGRGHPWYSLVGNMTKPMRMACDAVGLPSHVKPFHWGVRGTHITWLLNKGVPPVEVQHLADHSELSTTLGYFDTRKTSQANAVEMLE